jgi:hypothetical protein
MMPIDAFERTREEHGPRLAASPATLLERTSFLPTHRACQIMPAEVT